MIAIAKQVWSILYGGESGWAILPPMLIGLIVCNAAIYFMVKWMQKQQSEQTSTIAGHTSNIYQ